MKALLDPSIYELTDYERKQDLSKQRSMQIQHIKYLAEILNFITTKRSEGCDINLSFSQNQYYGLCNNYAHPWNQYTQLTNKNELIQTYSKIMKLSPKIDNIDNVDAAVPENTMKKFSKSTYYDDFCKHIGYFYINNIDNVVFYGRLNEFEKIVYFMLNDNSISFCPIYKITDLFNDSIRKILLSNIKYKCTPTTASPLPNVDICKEFINIKKQMINDGCDKIEVYIKIGSEVALRNNYHYDAFLTRLNSNSGCIRHIFKSNSAPYVYLSIDVRHGNFEVCDSNGHQIDEYTYDNQKQNKHDATGRHDIQLHK